MAQRVIKFRGKHLTSGDWRYGYLSKYWNSNMDIVFVIIKEADNRLSIATSQIDENTISQFTGLQSSEQGCGMPIKDAYFGDIIEFFNTDGKRVVTEIIWYEKELCIGFKRMSDGFIYTQRIFNDSGYFQPSIIQFNIIGNIYENPELLK